MALRWAWWVGVVEAGHLQVKTNGTDMWQQHWHCGLVMASKNWRGPVLSMCKVMLAAITRHSDHIYKIQHVFGYKENNKSTEGFKVFHGKYFFRNCQEIPIFVKLYPNIDLLKNLRFKMGSFRHNRNIINLFYKPCSSMALEWSNSQWIWWTFGTYFTSCLIHHLYFNLHIHVLLVFFSQNICIILSLRFWHAAEQV